MRGRETVDLLLMMHDRVNSSLSLHPLNTYPSLDPHCSFLLPDSSLNAFHSTLSSSHRIIHLLSSPPACPDGEQWRRTTSEGILLCERSCQDIYSSSPVNCSHSAEGCVCQEGLYRNPEGACVIPALCPCHDRGVLREVRRCVCTKRKVTSAAQQTWHLVAIVPASVPLV